MNEKDPFYRAKARQRQLPLALETPARPAPAHPATELVGRAKAEALYEGAGGETPGECADAKLAHAGRGLREAALTSPREADAGAAPIDANATGPTIPAEPEVVDADPPWWAAKQPRLSRPGFYAPVPVTIEGQASRAEAPPEGFAAFLQQRKRVRAETLVAQVSFACSRPRALLVLIGLVVVALVAANALTSYRSAQTLQDEAARAETLERSLALLDSAAAARAAASSPAVANATTTMPASGERPAHLSAATIEEYVNKAMPRLTGAQPASGGELPPQIQKRPLPLVPTGAVAAALPPKPPVGDSIDEPPAAPKRATASGKSTVNRISSSDAPRPFPSAPDPLAKLSIHGEVVKTRAPFRVLALRGEGKAMQAQVLGEQGNGATEAVWAGPGQVFAGGWTLVAVERGEAVFLSPSGRVSALRPNTSTDTAP